MLLNKNTLRYKNIKKSQIIKLLLPTVEKSYKSYTMGLLVLHR